MSIIHDSDLRAVMQKEKGLPEILETYKNDITRLVDKVLQLTNEIELLKFNDQAQANHDYLNKTFPKKEEFKYILDKSVCDKYLLDQIEQLKKENAELKDEINARARQDVATIIDLRKQNAELTEKLAKKCEKKEVATENKKIGVYPYNNDHLSTILSDDKFYLKLVEHGGDIDLVMCDKNGNIIPSGYLICFRRASNKWFLVSGVNADFGLHLDGNERLFIE